MNIKQKIDKINDPITKSFVKHIVDNGHISSDEISNKYDGITPATLIRRATRYDIPIIRSRVISRAGSIKTIFKLPSDADIQKLNKASILDDSKIGDIKTYIERIGQLNLDVPSDYIYFFRGHSDSVAYKIEPSIFREESWIKNENKMFREIIIKCPNDFTQSMSTFEKLVKMQHYSLPTRLLDITENPLVALYFACKSTPNEDGEVIIFKIPKSEIKYYGSDTVSVVANIAKRPESFTISKIKSLKIQEFNQNNEIKLLLHEIKEEKPYFESKINPEHLNSVICVKPKLNNPRVIRQDGAFLLFGMNDLKTKKPDIPNKYLLTGNSIKIIINKNGKAKLMKQLSSIGITDAKMFPEIDSVATYIKSSFKAS